MKSLLRPIIKIIYCIVLPAAMLITLNHVTSDPVLSGKMNAISYWVLAVSTAAVCLNGIFYFAIMSNTRMIPKKFVPKLSTEKWKGVGFGLGMEKRGTGILFVLPFVVLELSW